MDCLPVLINGQWREADAQETFQACNPTTRKWLPDEYPVSLWADCDAALDAAVAAARELRKMPGERIAKFLEAYAEHIEKRKDVLVETAYLETGLPRAPRLADVELPRTTSQLRQAAQAARDGSWMMATIDSKANIRSHYGPLGPVCVFGPNNFPFAFGSVSGGDFAAAIAAGNPVIGKANTSHPGTTRLFAEAALVALQETGLPPATVQLLYRLSHADGQQLVSDPRVGATGYTGSRLAGLKLKTAAESAGKPIYLELSSVNPVVFLPGAIRERRDEILQETVTSGLMGTGQFCTNPGTLLLVENADSEAFIEQLARKYQEAPAGVLLSASVATSLHESIQILQHAGAHVLAGGSTQCGHDGFGCANTLLRVSGETYLEHPHVLQTEAFGNCTLLVVCSDTQQMARILESLEGNLTGCIYSARDGSDDADYDLLAPELRLHVGRLLNDRMPTGVAVSSAMNHGGPFPATGHPGFTAVGIPASLWRFAALHCYDQVRPHRLPISLRDPNPSGRMWRLVDGSWSQADVPGTNG
jgi:alpha-ketoglutaric semialdehyde dehydrogenase